MHRKSSRISYFIAASIALLALLGGFLGSVASNEIPDGVKPYLSWVWLLLGIVAIAIVAFTIWQTKKQADTEPPSPALNSQNRQRMLSRVYNFWIKGVFEQSLHGAALIALGLNEQQDALANPWHLVIPQPDHSVRSLPSGTRITQVYDDADGELLILGEPGSGKTTLLLELARNLIERARKDETYPMPVVFNLSSWAVKHQPISNWLIEELNTKYQVPRTIGKLWMNTDQILPLLDGLDEVADQHREACMGAINDYHKQHMTTLVVCSRTSEYLALSTRLSLHSAAIIQPLTEKQIDDYLWSAGGQLEALRVALHSDSDLRELAGTPLMLSVLTLAYQGKSVEDLLAAGNVETRRKQTFVTYTQRMLQRRGLGKGYTPQQTIQYLTWLARQLMQYNQAVFYIERMQPDWLLDSRLQRVYRVACWLIDGPVSSLLFGLLIGLFGRLILGLTDGLVLGLVSGVVSGLLSVMYFKRSSEIQPAEIVVWSLNGRRVLGMLLFGLGLGLIAGLSFGLTNGLINGLILGLVSWLAFGLIEGLLIGLSSKQLAENYLVKPNQGIWLSGRNSLIILLIVGLIVGLVFGLCFWLFGRQNVMIVLDLFIWLTSMFLIGLVFGLRFGGVAFIQHFILRWFLWRAGSLPWNYPRFLDYAAECILLCKVGGGYIFVHRLLLEYFAPLDTTY